MGDDTSGRSGNMVAAADAVIHASLSSWSPSRYSLRQRREKEQATKLRQQQEQQQLQKQDSDVPSDKTLGLVNRKVLGLELVASPVLLAKHSEWNFTDWEERNNDSNRAAVQSTGTQSSVTIEDERPKNSVGPSGGANNEFVENESRFDGVVPNSGSSSGSIRSEIMNSNHAATRSGGHNEDPCPKDALYMTTTTNGGGVDGDIKSGSLRKKLTSLRRLGAPTRYSPPKKKNMDAEYSLELSDSLDEPFHDDANNGQKDENKPSNTNYTANHSEADKSSSSAADPTSTAVAGPAISPSSSLVKERSMPSVLDEANKCENWMLPIPLPYATTQVQKSDAESTATDTKSQSGMEVANDATPPCTPPILESTGVEGRTKEQDPSKESPTGVQELTLYQFFQQRLFPSCDDHNNKNTSSASCTSKEELDVPRDIEEEERLDQNTGSGGELSSVAVAASDDVGEVGEETTGFLDAPNPIIGPAVSDGNGFEDVMKDDAVPKPVDDAKVQEAMHHLVEEDAMVENTSSSKLVGGLSVTDDAGAKEGSSSSKTMVSGVMKKMIFRRKRLVPNNDDASTHHDTAAPKSPECVKLRHEQYVQDHEDNASNHTAPTEVNMSTDVLSVDPLTDEGELTLAQYLQQQADCGSDKNIIDEQDGADDVLDDPDVNEERSSDKCDMVDREVKTEASNMNTNVEYSGDLDNVEITEVDSVENSRDCDDINNRGGDYHGEIEDERSENELQMEEKKEQETSWFDSAIDNAVNDVVAAIDDDFVEDMLGVANQAAIVILKSVRKAIHSIDEVLSGCLEDEDDDESNKEGNDEDDEDDEEEEEVDDGLTSTDLQFLAAHNYDETTGKSMNDPAVINPEKDVSIGWKKSKTKLKSFVKLRRVKSVKTNFDC